MSAGTLTPPAARDSASSQDVVAALRAAGISEVDDSTLRRAEYSSDASLYRVVPRVVVLPRAVDEVLAAVDVCRRLGVPLTPRGAGTSIAGNAVGAGVVLDFSRYLGHVVAIDPEQRTATVEPGVVLAQLQREAGRHGLRFGPDPSTHNRCTLGGMIGNNACGSRALGYGRTADNVVELDVVAGTGERLRAGRGGDLAASSVLASVDRMVRANLASIRTELGRFGRQTSGYSLEHLLPEHGFDVAKALVGTEGTCAVLLGATVRLVRAPVATVLVALGYPDMTVAADAVPALLKHHPIAVEGLDARIVDAVVSRRGASAVPELPDGRGWLFVELAGDSEAELAAATGPLIADAGTSASMVVTDPKHAAALWRIREDGAGLSARSPRGRPAHAGWEDAAVPPERLGAYLRAFEALTRQHDVTGMPYGHFGDGCLHVRLDFPLDEPGGAQRFRAFLLDAADLVASHGGSMSGEHGDGRARGELLERMYSPAVLDAFAEFKGAFDPQDVLNPGVIVRPRPVDADLRVPAAPPLRERLAFAYPHDGGDLSTAVHRCTGVGKCLANTTGSGGVMCPSYQATRNEKDSTRGRARVLQEMVNGTLVRAGWRSPEVHEALDLCLSCKGCASDCPTGIDMATYKAEVLHQAYRGRLRPRTHYSLGALPRWARLASRMPRLANRMLTVRPLAAIGKWLAGVDARRPLPTFATRTFRQWFADRRPAATGVDPVLLWVDTFTNHFTPEVGIAAVRVLEAAGYEVRIPDAGLCCGLTWISTGQTDAAKRILRRTVAALAPHAEAGVPIVGLEPSCTAVFRGDLPELLGTGDSAVSAVAAATRTLAELLTDRPQWTPPRLDEVHAIAQPHCHHHAVLGWHADQSLLSDAGASVDVLGGCCGLAGNFGMERGHYEVSTAVAEVALLPAVRAAEPDTVVLADGFSCRIQLDQLAGRRGRHLAEVLAERLDSR
ncbi:FAD-binding and (Fe-S)-binding domain-containing protein [Rugosimonospora africana]|uniref:Lactate dehydrogenase n=1 Tax=Rugosimonospora africana TaxID=556532 RepID=A0A8J3QP59_9ACTN|nr:FAD-binding and (Fe-S)-binding domain-containing protein [Rugosimonospora africana]GIH14444.1 lactate dehydrogenase [Rugosimonospora africana]